MKKTLTGLLMAFPFLCLAQANYKAAYRVTNDGDTVKGFVDYKERAITPSSFIFKTSKESPAQEYNLSNTLAYGVNDAEHFRRFVVNISMSTENLQRVSTGIDTTSRTDTVFLNLLTKGKVVSLYSYQDDIKKRFFVQKNNELPVELQRSLFMSLENKSMAITNSRYRNQLQALHVELHPDAPVEDRKWLNLSYTQAELKKAIASLNNEEVIKSKYASNRFFIGTGVNVAKASYSGDHFFSSDGTALKTSVLPFLTFGMDYFTNPAVRRIIYRIELSFLAGQYELSRFEDKGSYSALRTADKTHTFTQYTLQLSPQVVYNIYNAIKTQVYLSGGLSFSESLYKKNVLTEKYEGTYIEGYTKVITDPIDFKGFNFAPRVGAGLVLNNRMEIALGYSISAPVTNYVSYSVNVQRMTVGVTYLLGKNNL